MFHTLIQRFKKSRPRQRAWSWGLVAVLTAALLGGCGGQQADTTAQSDNGEVVIGLTDAEGDFLNYAVDVVSIELTRADGLTVETLPLNSRIDFAQYVDLTEFITTATIPTGTYTRARLRLDYSDADVQVEVDGVPTPATLVDSDGDPITTLEVAVRLDDRNSLRIAPGVPAHLTLDFDLNASNEVDTSQTPPVVTVEPVLLADIDLQAPKPHRLRGLLDWVDPETQTLSLAMRPLLHNQGNFGHLKAQTDADTLFEINGVSYQGEAGLAALAELPQGTWTIVFGLPSVTQRNFLAHEVYAGSSVAGSEHDSIAGIIVGREGDRLTVDAKAIVGANGRLAFHRRLSVQLADDTPVSRQGSSAEFGKDDLSVGQAIYAIGTMTSEGLADLIQVRMIYSDAGGEVVSANDGELVINLHDINSRPATAFDFSGTGLSPEQDADASQYQIDPAGLPLDGLAWLEPVRVRGFVSPWGSAPADFQAWTISDFGSLPAGMAITWPEGTAAPFSSLSSEQLVVDLSDSRRHHLRRRHIITDLTDFDSAPTLVASEQGRHLFAIRQRDSVQVYGHFDDFSAALNEALDGATGVAKIYAQGHFDNASVTLSADLIGVILKPLTP